MVNAVSAQNLGKRYRVGGAEIRYDSFRDLLTGLLAAPFRKYRVLKGEDESSLFWALKDLTFDIPVGQVTGVIGRNGAGKSTLLKVLSRITHPTEGEVRIRGKVASLLEVGSGFHPELTGRENIFMNGRILGMTRREIADRFDDIVSFAEIEQFIDTPVKRYSSGMYVRLAFSVAAHVNPDVLLVDEILAVGDTAFQQRCIGKLSDVGEQGRTVVFVSHNLDLVKQLCSHVIYLKNGGIQSYGPADEVIGEYLGDSAVASTSWEAADATSRIRRLEIKNRTVPGRSANTFTDQLEAAISFVPDLNDQQYVVGIRITSQSGQTVFTSIDTDSCARQTRRGDGYVALCALPSQILRPGQYFLSALIHKKQQHHFKLLEDATLGFEIAHVDCPVNAARTGTITPVLPWRVEALTS